MIGPGLALEQAPPFPAVLRFFLTAPWFLAAAGLLAALFPDWIPAPQSPVGLALTHLLTLGFLAMAMLGAMSQMLPVVSGAPLPAVVRVAGFSHGGLTLGAPLLAAGLYLPHPMLLLAGALALSLGFAVFLIAVTIALARARASDTTWAMRLAAVSLVITVGFGLGLAAWLAGLWTPPGGSWLGGHVLWGLAGWIGALVLGSAWQVVPMLQLTPPYPPRLTRALWLALLVGLPTAALLPGRFGLVLPALALVAFAGATLWLQSRRKRKLADVTLDFWRVGMVCLIFACLTALLAPDETPWNLAAALAFLLGFAVSVVIGMLYKIIPFLAWFHLQAQIGFKPGQPTMRDYLPEARARGQFRLYLAALACLLPAPFLPILAVPGGVLLAASACWLGINLIRAVRLYQRAGAAGGR